MLRRAMCMYFCYTTVFNAIELFSLCRSAQERRVVENVMQSMKILGLNGKSAKNIGLLFAGSRKRRTGAMEGLIAGVCKESRLPILTGNPDRYSGVRSLRVMTVDSIAGSHKKGFVWS